MTLRERVKDLCKANGISLNKLENECGLGKGYVSKLDKSVPNAKNLQKIADYLGVSLDYLTCGEEIVASNIHPIALKKFPMIGEIACGEPRYANEDRESYVLAGADIKADCCLTARGDSMIGARIHDGDIVFIRRQDMVENGEIAAVVVNNDSEATLKRFYYYPEDALLILKPENPMFKEQVYRGEQLNEVHILGKAIAFQSDVI